MAGRELTARVQIRRPAPEVFDFVADYRNVPRLMEGVRTWEPVGHQATGVGARYRVELSALGLNIAARVRITEWDPAQVIAWTSEASPISNHGRWRFTPRSAGAGVTSAGCEVSLRLVYVPPAGGVGNFLAGRVEGIVRGRILAALKAMKAELEGP